MSKFRLICGWVVCAGSVLGLSVEATEAPVASAQYRGTSRAVHFDVSPALRDVAPLPVPRAPVDGGLMVDPESGILVNNALAQDLDPLVQAFAPFPRIPAPSASFDSLPNLSGVSPPDPVGDVGPNHYVAMSNLSFQVHAKDGTSLFGPAANNTLWSGFGGPCQTENSGDPVVLYDQLADRWLLTQFTSAGPGFFNCVALSTSPDPTGSYFRWAFSTGSNFPDYPKYGVWPNAYLISTREFAGAPFAGVGAYALNRQQMLAGNPAPQVISFLAAPGATPYTVGDGLLPVDLEGLTLPPNGSPAYYLGSMDNGGPYGAPQDALNLWKFVIDFANPPASSFTLTNVIPIAPFDTIFPCSPGARDCIAQPGTANKIDILSYRQRPLHRFAYRNFGSHESLVSNQSVEAQAGIAGVRWWELRSPNSSPLLFQEGTFAPGVTDGVQRWMASAAMDSAGNIALGYSASSATVFPSSRYSGRLVSDPLGSLPQGEGEIIAGTGSQTGSQRWGDYTSLNVDPIDDCTFWFINEYVPVTSNNGWRLRVGSFRFNECGTPGFTLSAATSNQTICAGSPANYTLNVGSISSFDSPVTLVASGNPAPTTTLFSPNPVPTLPGSTTLSIANTAGVAGGTYSIGIDATATGADPRSTTVGLTVVESVPAAVTLVAPAAAAVAVSPTAVFSWNAIAGADQYVLEIADDVGFSNIVFTTTVATTSVAASGLLEDTAYFWRVRSSNVCGPGTVSAVRSFRTGITSVVNLCYTGPAVVIPDNNATGAFADLVVPNTGPLADIDVSTTITHTWPGDLSLRLTRVASNTTVILGSRLGGTGCQIDNVDASFNDQGGLPIACAASPPGIAGVITPENPLSAFAGLDLASTWRLTAVDGAGQDTGSFIGFCLNATTIVEGSNPDVLFKNGFE